MDLSTLADLGPNHNTSSMPFDSVDVARVARAVEAKPVRLTRLLFGLHPTGIAHLLRKLWLAGEATANELTLVKGAYEIVAKEANDFKYKFLGLQQDVRTITYQLDRVIERFGAKKAGVLLISPGDMMRLEDEYNCPDKKRASSTERWAYTYRGHRVFTVQSMVGPTMMEPNVFEGFKLAVGKAVVLREM